MVREESPFAVLYADLDNFKAYNDQKGFVRGDRLIQATREDPAGRGRRARGRRGLRRSRRGRRLRGGRAARRRRGRRQARWSRRFDEQIHEFYDPEDVERGYVEVEDRKGELQRLPLVGVSIGIATTKVRSFAHYGEAVSVATEMKQYAKREPESSYAVDRRKVD